jgi:phosphoglycolate phosphatase
MIKGVIFDKDGTLFDFNATWGAWSRRMLASEAGGDTEIVAQLADVLGYDMDTDQFVAGSIVVAEPVEVIADTILRILPKLEKGALIKRMNTAAATVPQVEVTPLWPCLRELRDMGLKLGVATNDGEAPARAHIEKAGVTDLFDFIAGSDSGFGGKPATGQLDAFCEATGLSAANCLMVGDSLHDVMAGQAAGMQTVGVLTGPAVRDDLAPHADVVLGSIAELADWIKNTT